MSEVGIAPGNNSARLWWTTPVNGAEVELGDYYVQVESDGRIVSVPSTQNEVTISGLRNGVEEAFTVYSSTDAGRGPPAARVSTTPTSGMEGEVAGIIVRFTDPAPIDAGQTDVPGEDAVAGVGMKVGSEIADDVHLVELSEAVTTEQANQVAAQLQSDPGVEWAEPDVFVFPSSTEINDPSFATEQWNLWDEYGLAGGSAEPGNFFTPEAGAGTTVAVIDTGITSHPDLDSQIVPGYDFVSNPDGLAAPRTPGGAPVPFDADDQPGRDSDPTDPGDWRGVAPERDSTWHGTHIAGVIAAQAGNTEGIVGVAPGAKIQPVRAISWRGGLLSDIIASITWASGGVVEGAATNASPADVITMSFAANARCSVAMQNAIDGANDRGSILVAAAGNANDDIANYTPANCSGVIAVGATGRDGKRAPYSNHGAGIDISAPGGSITSGGGVLSTSNSGSNVPMASSYSAAEGTSIAAAHVAGAIARVRSNEPMLAPGDLRGRIIGDGQVRPFSEGQCDADPSLDCGSGILALAQVATAVYENPSLAPGVTSVSNDSWKDTRVDCDQITETADFYTTMTQANSWLDITIVSGRCTVTGTAPMRSGNPALYALSSGQYVAITRTSNGHTLTIRWGSAPPTPRLALSRATVTAVINEAITPVTVTPVNFAPNSYTVSPALPTGIAMDSSTGEIAGTPTSNTPLSTYTITGSNGGEQATTTIAIRVLLEAPRVVTFDQEVGTDPQPLEAAPSIVLPSTTGTKSNHVFAGWYTAATGGDFVGVGGETYTPTSSVTLYARWLPSVRFQFRLSSGVDDGLPSSITPFYAQGTEYTLPTPTRTGSSQTIFNGWYSQSSGGTLWGMGGDVITLPTRTAGSTLQAWDRWRSPYTFRFDPRGGTIDGCVDGPGGWAGTCAITESAGITLPTPTRPGHRFDGWWSSSSGGTFYGAEAETPRSSLPSNSRIYAQWSAFTLTGSSTSISALEGSPITSWTASASGFIPTSFSVSPSLPSGLAFDTSTGVISGTPTAAHPVTTHTVTGSDGASSASVTILIEVTALGTVSFDTNTGDVADPVAVTAAPGTSISLPEVQRSGYTFRGWFFTQQGGRPVDDPYTVTGDVTLYAQWRQVPRSVPAPLAPPATSTPEEPRRETRPPRVVVDPPARPNPQAPAVVIVDGEASTLRVERDQENTELDVSSDDFTLAIATADEDRVRVPPTTQQRLVAPVRGYVGVEAKGYAPQTYVSLFIVPDTQTRGRLRIADDPYYLGEALVGDDEALASEFRIPDWAAAGEYVLQVNGYTPEGSVRSINVRLDLIDVRADAVSAARACIFPESSTRLTRECRQSLRSLATLVPESVDSLTIDITGVAYAQGPPRLNRAVAQARAERIERYLAKQDIRGDTTIDVVVRKNLPVGLTLDPPPPVVVGENGKPASTVLLTVEWTTQIGPATALGT